MVYQNIMDSEGVVKALFSTAGSSCAGLDAQAKDVISNLLLFIPNRRLGMRHDGMKDIWTHPAFSRKDAFLIYCHVCVSCTTASHLNFFCWFSELSQEKIENKSVKAPLL